MSVKGLFKRWYRYDDNGKRTIKRFPINTTPYPLKEDGYTEWTIGHGPMTEEQYDNRVNIINMVITGKPKSTEQKAKMRLAKLDKPKTTEHKENISIAMQEHSEMLKAQRRERYRIAKEILEAIRRNNG